MKTTIFIDMDGVLAKWNTEASVEETYEPGYFLRRTPEAGLVDIVNKLLSEGKQVVILSAVYGQEQANDKLVWLRRIFDKWDVINPIDSILGYYNDDSLKTIFCPYGGSKRDYVINHAANLLGDKNILIDDFSKNLREWTGDSTVAQEFYGIKFINGINDTHKSWKGPRLYADDTFMTMYFALKGFTEMFQVA